MNKVGLEWKETRAKPVYYTGPTRWSVSGMVVKPIDDGSGKITYYYHIDQFPPETFDHCSGYGVVVERKDGKPDRYIIQIGKVYYEEEGLLCQLNSTLAKVAMSAVVDMLETWGYEDPSMPVPTIIRQLLRGVEEGYVITDWDEVLKSMNAREIYYRLLVGGYDGSPWEDAFVDAASEIYKDDTGMYPVFLPSCLVGVQAK